MKGLWRMLLMCLALLALLSAGALAEEYTYENAIKQDISVSSLMAELPANQGKAEIYATEIDGELWLFLPSFADIKTLVLTQDGETLSWEMTSENDGVCVGDLRKNDEIVGELSIMQSQNLRSLFLYSDDPVNFGRAYVDAGSKFTARTTGSMAIVDLNGTVDYTDHLRQIRIRGNLSSHADKKAYQIKLENRTDLLKTGDPSESNRTWILLADHMDKSMLHNRIALDVAREFGIENASHCEHVDVYYDGEYRGLYLLAEKVEVAEGRIEIDDYDEMLEMWNERAGQSDLEALEVQYSKNKYGNYIAYIDGVVDSDHPGAGGYLLEMEHEAYTLTDRCWLHLGDRSVLGVKNPENASKRMMLYISELLEEARLCLMNGGINPDTELTMNDYFDVEAFVRVMLVYEALQNLDGYGYSSSWFVLPAESKRFEPGPVWDFDMGMRERRDGENVGGIRQNTSSTWTEGFYSNPVFLEQMKTAWQKELYPILCDILLGDQQGRYLKPLNAYTEEIDAAYRMNDMIWNTEKVTSYVYGETWEEDVEILRAFLTDRFEWLNNALVNASADGEHIYLWGHATYLKLEEELKLYVTDWSRASVQLTSLEKLEDATEEDYAVWQLEAILTPDAGITFEDPVIYFRDSQIGYEKMDDGTLRIAFTFEDPSYRPVDYYGEDIGLIYNPDVYAQNYPEIAEMYEDDPEGLMNHFCDEGMYEDQKGNAFFRPSEVLTTFPNLYELLGDDWVTYYWDFIYYGFTDGWLRRLGYGFPLNVVQSLL